VKEYVKISLARYDQLKSGNKKESGFSEILKEVHREMNPSRYNTDKETKNKTVDIKIMANKTIWEFIRWRRQKKAGRDY